jgi:hypothetical protein
MKISENVGCFLGGSFFTMMIVFMLSSAVGAVVFLAVFALGLIGNLIVRKSRSIPLSKATLIYSQSNWAKEWQQILVVEVPLSMNLTVWDLKNERLALPLHFDLLRQRYCALAERAIEEGQMPQQMVEYFLGVKVIPLMQDVPHEVASSITASEAFTYVISARDDPRAGSYISDQHRLRLIYDESSLEQILRLLQALYLNNLNSDI